MTLYHLFAALLAHAAVYAVTPTERMMQRLAPHVQRPELAAAIDEATEQQPLFQADDDRTKTRALLVAIAYRESTFLEGAIGDHGQSVCEFQIMGGPRSLLTDVRACVAEAMRQLVWSVKSCPRFPVAGYASGPLGCHSIKAQRVSNDRMWLAKEIAR